MGPNQRYPGYCVLLCKIKEASELSDLPPEFRADFLADMARMAEAIQSVTDCYKLNYEALGNVCHHLHWHVFPRYADDPERLKPIWMVDEVIPYDEATHGSIRREIGEALG